MTGKDLAELTAELASCKSLLVSNEAQRQAALDVIARLRKELQAPIGKPTPSVDVKSPEMWHYFVHQMAVLYNRGQHVLVGRQVLPYCDCGQSWFASDVRVVRVQVLMQSEDKYLTGSMVPQPERDRVTRNGDLMLEESSYTQHMRSSSIVGFLGRSSRAMPISAAQAQVLEDLSTGWKNYAIQPVDAADIILPTFWVRIDPVNNPIADAGFVAEHRLSEIFNVATGQWIWCQKLDGVKPVVVCAGVYGGSVGVLEAAFARDFMLQPIFIGHNVVEPGAPEYGKFLGDRSLFGQKVAIQKYLEILVENTGIRFPVFFQSVCGDKVKADAWVRSVLNASAMKVIGELETRYS